MNQKVMESRSYALWQWLVPPFFLSLFTALWYYPSLYYAFQFDDLANIVKFFDIRHKTFNDLCMTSTRWISAWLNTMYYKIGKFDPWAYRVGNVTVHCVAGLLLFFVLFLALKRIKKETIFKTHAWGVSVITTALFLLHPVQTQTVSYVIQGQLEGIAGLFVIAIAASFMAAFTVHNKFARALFLIAMYALAFLSMGTKEIAIVSPALVALLDWFFIAQGDWKSFKSRIFVHILLGVEVLGIYFYLVKPTYFMSLFSRQITNNIGNVLTEDPRTKITMANYSISQFKVVLHYIAIFIWPFSISVDYDWKLSRHFFAPDCFFPFLLFVFIAGWMVYRLRKDKTDILVAAFIWFFIAILPRSSIIPATELMADYKTYLSSVGILLLMAAGLIKLGVFLSKNIKIYAVHPAYGQTIAATCVFGMLGWSTYHRNLVWQSSTHFWENIIKNAPGRARAYNNYGVALSEKGNYPKAIENFKIAMRMDRHYSDPCNNIAVAFSVIGKLDEAIGAIQQSLRIQPYYPEGYNNLASFLIQKRDFENAKKSLYTAIKLRPHYGKAYFNLGRLHLEKGDKQLAYESFKQCCTKADFDNEIGFGAYAGLCLQLAKYDEAIAAYTKALECKPDHYENRFNLANVYYLNQNYIQARDLFVQLCRQNPNDAKSVFNLAETYLALNDYPTAIEHYKQAHALNPRMGAPLIRSATCYQRLGDISKSKSLLNEVLAADFPKELKGHAQMALAQLGR